MQIRNMPHSLHVRNVYSLYLFLLSCVMYEMIMVFFDGQCDLKIQSKRQQDKFQDQVNAREASSFHVYWNKCVSEISTIHVYV